MFRAIAAGFLTLFWVGLLCQAIWGFFLAGIVWGAIVLALLGIARWAVDCAFDLVARRS